MFVPPISEDEAMAGYWPPMPPSAPTHDGDDRGNQALTYIEMLARHCPSPRPDDKDGVSAQRQLLRMYELLRLRTLGGTPLVEHVGKFLLHLEADASCPLDLAPYADMLRAAIAAHPDTPSEMASACHALVHALTTTGHETRIGARSGL